MLLILILTAEFVRPPMKADVVTGTSLGEVGNSSARALTISSNLATI